jgi:putative acetyltransferase
VSHIDLSIIRYDEAGFSITAVKELFRLYHAHIGINLDFQDFEAEYQGLPGKYHPAQRGQLYLALYDQLPVGCAAIYQYNETQCEIKRVFVLPQYQGLKISKQLMKAALEDAKAFGYQAMILDSLHRFKTARLLYLGLGFTDIEAYNDNPHEDVYYMQKFLGLADEG